MTLPISPDRYRCEPIPSDSDQIYEAQKRSRRARKRFETTVRRTDGGGGGQTDGQTAACNGDDVIRTVLLLLTGRGLGRRDRGRRSIVNRLLRLMRMHGVDGRRGHMGQGRRRRARLMMIVMMMNAAPRVESISAPVDDRRRRGRQAGGSAAQNRGARRAAAGHGAAGHGYGWKTDGTALGDYASSLRGTSASDSVASRAQMPRNNYGATEKRVVFHALQSERRIRCAEIA